MKEGRKRTRPEQHQSCSLASMYTCTYMHPYTHKDVHMCTHTGGGGALVLETHVLMN